MNFLFKVTFKSFILKCVSVLCWNVELEIREYIPWKWNEKNTIEKGQLVALKEWITSSHTLKKKWRDLFEIYLFSGSIDQFDKVKKKKIIEKLSSLAISTMYHIYYYTHSQQIFI